VELALQAPQPFVLLGHGAEVLLKDNLLGRTGAHDFGQPQRASHLLVVNRRPAQARRAVIEARAVR
jgi:hypothetical protein